MSIRRSGSGECCIVLRQATQEAALLQADACFDGLAGKEWHPELRPLVSAAAELRVKPSAAGTNAAALLQALWQQLKGALEAPAPAAAPQPAAGGCGPSAHRGSVKVAKAAGKKACVIPAAALLAVAERFGGLVAALAPRLAAASGWELSATGGERRLVLLPGPQMQWAQLVAELHAALK